MRKRWKKLLKKKFGSRRPWEYAVGLLSVAIILYVGIDLAYTPVMNVYEDVAFAIDPSAIRAFTYGERHFSSMRGAAYDVNRAEKYFILAASLDPHFPYVYHELARIAFLRGDFAKAVAEINLQIQYHGDTEPNSYYVRGLIEGYMGDYDAAAKDYAYFLTFDPTDWAGINDYAWVLLKAGRAQEAAAITSEGLKNNPQNPWLLNSNSIALYETGDAQLARVQAHAAWSALQNLTLTQWLHSYPGNDPASASVGMETFRRSVMANMQHIDAAVAAER
jgi:tetratricopeptide (TPR) repeat protein